MIFVTVGTQLAFPRLIGAMDAFAAATDEPVVAQVGPDPEPRAHLDRRDHLTPAEFDRLFAEARVVVGHAGIGTILSARRLGRPLVVLPRRYVLGEHRNDHQAATARAVESLPGIRVARDEKAIPDLLSSGELVPAGEGARSDAHAALLHRLKVFIGE